MMVSFPSVEALSAAKTDAELNYAMRGLSATVRLMHTGNGESVDFVFEGAGLATVRKSQGDATLTMSADDNYWGPALSQGKPAGDFMIKQMSHFKTEGDFLGVTAPYQAGIQRLLNVFKDAARPPIQRTPFQEMSRDTDTAVGRYVWVKANGTEARMYYEESGTGKIPLLLQATAGADSRQYRYLLADPDMQSRFRMIAYDLPYHGRSMPPSSDPWWQQAYKPTGDYLMNWIVGLVDTLKLDQPYFMGCSVGGQVALDLAAEHPNKFGAFISLNGSYDALMPEGFTNDIFRTPSISSNLAPGAMLSACTPMSSKRNAHEVNWIYGSGYPGIYAGDNDYYIAHDLKKNGHKIDGKAKPVYLVVGEYDPAAHDQEHGAPAVIKNIPSIEYIVLENQGHFTMTDDPEGFKDAILPILDRIIKSTST